MYYYITLYTYNHHSGCKYNKNIGELRDEKEFYDKELPYYELTYEITKLNAKKLLLYLGFDKTESYESGDIAFKKNSNEWENVEDIITDNFIYILDGYAFNEIEEFKIYFRLIEIKYDYL